MVSRVRPGLSPDDRGGGAAGCTGRVADDEAVEAAAEVPPIPVTDRVVPMAVATGCGMAIEAMGVAADEGVEVHRVGEACLPAVTAAPPHSFADTVGVDVKGSHRVAFNLQAGAALVGEGEGGLVRGLERSRLVFEGELAFGAVVAAAALEGGERRADRFGRGDAGEGEDHVGDGEQGGGLSGLMGCKARF